jgi:hypothetical protein
MPKFPRIGPLPFALAIVLAAGLAQAQTRHLEATGSSFAVDSSCAREVTIDPDPSLSGRVVVDATADHAEEIAQLVFDSGATAKLHIQEDECWRQGNFIGNSPTMRLAIRVPAGFGVSIDEGGGAKYRIGAVGGALSLDLSGGVNLTAAKVTALKADISGGAEVNIAGMDGPSKTSISGGGTVTVQHGELSALSLDISGGGGFTLTQGAVATLELDMSGGGTAHIGGTVGTAALDVSGGGTVDIAKVTGPITKDVSGSATLNIGQ